MTIKPNALHDALTKRGYTFRRHLEEEGWGWFQPNVMDFDRVHGDALKYGGVEELRNMMSKRFYRPPTGLWTFPSFDIEAPVPRQPDVILSRQGVVTALAVAPRQTPALWALAEKWVATVKATCGLAVPLVDDAEAGVGLLETQSLVVFGGAHQNRLALALALRYRTMFVDASVPGDDGWVVTTHCGLNAAGHAVAQVAAAPEYQKTVLDILAQSLASEGGNVRLRYVHQVQPGAVMKANFPSWETFAAGLPKRITQLQGKTVDVPTDVKALSELLAVGLDSGGIAKSIYNVAPVDIANDAVRYYQLSADPRALQLFRELLFRLTDYYLKTPGGACYPADLDFRLGLLVLNFAHLEHLPVFDDEERLILVNLLLACSRAVHEYATKCWPMKPGDHSRHNHPTFKALTLLYVSDYFRRFNLPYIKDWLAYTTSVFECNLWERSKQRENARSYEPFVFDHAAAYALFTGKGLERFRPGCYERLAERQIAATDNFFRAVDYGDTGIEMGVTNSVSTRLLATQGDGLFRWFSAATFARKPTYIPASFLDFPGVRTGASSFTPSCAAWEELPLDAIFMEEVSPGFPRELALDKLAFRTGWGDDDQYLLLEGVGGNVGHSHHEVNGVVRLNHLGRHWIVSNGYGRRVGIASATEGFRTRELGPVDHNMLVVRRSGEIARNLTMNAWLQRGGWGRVWYATGAQLGYGGVDWFRTTVVVAGAYVLVIDRVAVREAGLEGTHIEWNGLGAAVAQADGFRLDQQGVSMDIASASGWQAELKAADQSSSWKQVLDDGSYPFAQFPLAKVVFHVPGLGVGETSCLGTLLAARRGERVYRVSQPERGRIVVEGPHDAAAPVRDGDLTITAEAGRLEVRFAAVPAVPETLARWQRSRKS